MNRHGWRESLEELAEGSFPGTAEDRGDPVGEGDNQLDGGEGDDTYAINYMLGGRSAVSNVLLDDSGSDTLDFSDSETGGTLDISLLHV